MFNFEKKSRFLLAAVLAGGIVACDNENDDYVIPESNVEVIVPREVVVEVTAIEIGDDDLEAIAMRGVYTITAIAPAGVDKVEFYNGSELLGEDTEAPFTWDLTSFGEFNIIAKGYSGGVVSGEDDATINILFARYPASMGTLQGDGAETWVYDGPTEFPFPADGQYPGFVNWDGGGDLTLASGVNLPIYIPETGEYQLRMGLASGWADAESFMYLYFDDNVADAQRSPAVPPDGWIAFATYDMPDLVNLSAGEHMAKIRFGGPYVHFYYLDILPVAGQ